MTKFGIDISLWQKGFNFTAAKAEGVEFAIIKCSEADFFDPQFENHYSAAKYAGIPVGAYHFCTAKNENEARLEADACLNAIRGKQFEYPIYLDFENSSANNYRGNSKEQNTAIVRAFLEKIEAAGYFAGFYCNYDFYINALNGSELAERYTHWLASWSANMPISAPMWQFGGTTNYLRSNTVAGVICDQNYCYTDFPAIIKELGLNGYTRQDKNQSSEAVYTVVAGDTLSAIAKKYNTTYGELAKYNNISDPNVIFVGQRIKIPTAVQGASIDEAARAVIRGDYGNGAERKRRLEAAGYNYSDVQKRVDELLR